jgi:hypothetical protein
MGLKINDVIVRESNQMKQRVEDYYKTLRSGGDNNNRNDHNNTLSMDFISATDDDYGNQLTRDITMEEFKKRWIPVLRRKVQARTGSRTNFTPETLTPSKKIFYRYSTSFWKTPTLFQKTFQKGPLCLYQKNVMRMKSITSDP